MAPSESSGDLLPIDLMREALLRYVEKYGAGILIDVLAGQQIPTEAQADTLRALVVAAVNEARGPIDYNAIMEKLGGRYKLRSVQNALGWAVKQRHIVRLRPGRFRAKKNALATRLEPRRLGRRRRGREEANQEPS